MIILGIDIGLHGAIATLDTDTGELLDVVDMPTLDDGPKGRATLCAPLLVQAVSKSGAAYAFVELVNARPGEGAVGAFSFGRCRGVIEGILGALGMPSEHITPASWKRVVGIQRGAEGAKDAARSEAIRRWPKHAEKFARKRDDGRAEAALIAIAGWERAKRCA